MRAIIQHRYRGGRGLGGGWTLRVMVLGFGILPRVQSLVLPWCTWEEKLKKRQSVSSPAVSTASDDTGGNTGDGVTLSLGIILPLVIILSILVLAAVFWIARHKFAGLFAGSVRQTITAESLASATNLPESDGQGRRGGDGRGDTIGSMTTNVNGSSVTVQDRADDTQRRRRRGVRRTESGRSIRTLPEYSKEAGDEELVLVRQRSADTIDEDLEGSEDTHPETAPLRRVSSARSATSLTEAPVEEEEVIEADIGDASGVTSAPSSAPLLGQHRRNLSSISRRGWGEAPTYLEAMSSPAQTPSALEDGVPPPHTPALRDRASTTFRGLLNRAAVSFAPSRGRTGAQHGGPSTEMRERRGRGDRRFSSQSLLLQPQTSRISSLASTPARHSREGSLSPSSRSPWASTHSLQISSPVPNTAVRASFDLQGLPRAGLSDDQMRFLSSSEAVNLVGIKLGDVPGNKRRRRSTATMLGESSGAGAREEPPTWDEVRAEAPSDQDPPAASNGEEGSGLETQDDSEPVGTPQSPVNPAQVAPPASHSTAPSLEIVPATPISPSPAFSEARIVPR